MAEIISQTFADGANLALQLQNEEWGREFAIGSDWTRIRLGFMANLIPDGTANITSAQLRFGFSSSSSMHFGSQSAGLFYGGLMPNSGTYTGGTFTYNAGGGEPYFSAGGIYRVRSLAGTLSGGSSAGSPYIATNTGTTARRSVFMVELLKSGTSMIVGAGSFNGGTGSGTDHTLAEFRSAMTTADLTGGTAPTVGSDAMQNWGTNTFTNHDTNAATHGETDSVHIGFNKGLVEFLNIFAVEVYRFA